MALNTLAPVKQAAATLEALFRPRGIAVAGSFADRNRPGTLVLGNLLEAGYPGHVAVLDGSLTTVMGVQAYPSLALVPGPVEVLILAGPAGPTPELIAELGQRARLRKDLRAVILLGEGSPPLAEECHSAGVRLIGPHCAAVVDNKTRVLVSSLAGLWRRPGGISLLSQSGSLGAWMALELGGMPLPVGLNKLASLGDMGDGDLAEMLDFLGKDPTTRAVGLCLDGGPGPGPALAEAAARVGARKPLVLLDTALETAFLPSDLMRVSRVDDFLVTLNAFDKLPLPLGGRIALLANAAGPARYLQSILRDVSPAMLAPATRTSLTGLLPPGAALGQPDYLVDMTAAATPRQISQAIAVALRDPGVDAVLHLVLPTRACAPEEIARELLQLLPGIKRHSLDKPYLPILLGGPAVVGARRLLEENGLVTFGAPDQAAVALAALVRYGSDRQPPSVAAAVGTP